MNIDLTVLVFGANGKLGSHFVNQALAAGYKIKSFVRSPEKYKILNNRVEVFKGDVTNYHDVESAIKGSDIVVSCLGNPNKKVLIMKQAYNNIMSAASKQFKPPRCIMISSIGLGGSAWFVKFFFFNK